MYHKENHSTTYAGILHYTKLSRGRSRTDIRESFFRAFTVVNIGVGNSIDSPIKYRELVGANQRGESKYTSNEHRAGKHFEAREPPKLRALYPDKSFCSPATRHNVNNYLPNFFMRYFDICAKLLGNSPNEASRIRVPCQWMQ
jgi:hypothetical protein